MNTEQNSNGLVDGPRLLELVFPDKKCRPSLRWLRDQQKRKAIPFARMGRLVFFDAIQVREAINDRHTIQPKRCQSSLP